MGVPTGGGTNLGTAQGRIRIDTGDVQRAQNEVQNAAKSMIQSLSAVGIAVGAAQLGRFVVQADAVATSYRRQSVAALSLAGSQAQLNDLLRVYNDVTGGAIDKATALNDVTRLMAVGFADSTEELEEFVRASRGISVATGQQQDYVISQLQLAIANQSTMRLDQLGLGVEEVQVRIDELRASNSGLTKEMAYQQAILGLAEEKFGALTDSAEAQATGLEKLQKAWKDFQLQFGEGASGGTNLIFEQWAKDIEQLRQELEWFFELLNRAQRAGSIFRFNIGLSNPPAGMAAPPMGPRVAPPSALTNAANTAPDPVLRQRNEAIADWAREVQEIERQAARDRIEATRQYEAQRAQVIRDYGKSIAREAEDFARQRARAEEDYALNLQRIHRDIAQREAQQAAELERTIGDARADAAERAAERQADLEERIAETRAATQERIAELEADFNKRRERAAEDHRDRIEDAAGRLDAIGVREAQKNFARSQRDAREDFDERLARERKNEAKRLEELNKAHAKQTEDEQAALEKRIRQAQEAYQRQIDAARIADAQRLEDMAADFQLRKEREDEDRAIRLERMAEDHADQLAEMDRQQALRMVQINEQEAKALRSANEAFDEQMASLGIYHAGVLEKQQAHQTRSLVMYQQYLDAQEAELARRMAIQGPAPLNPMITPGGYPRLQNNYTSNGSIAPSGSRAVTFNGDVSVVVAGTTNMSEEQMYNVALRAFADALQEMA